MPPAILERPKNIGDKNIILVKATIVSLAEGGKPGAITLTNQGAVKIPKPQIINKPTVKIFKILFILT
jgi:F420-0:gamma-glutamyl ligase